MKAITYQQLYKNHLNENVLDKFNRYQEVSCCWRKQNDEWFLIDNPYIEDWDLEKKRNIVSELVNCVNNNGVVYGAIIDNTLIGFSCISADFFGKNNEYIELLIMQVSTEYRNKGIGKQLFKLIAGSARQLGARKIYISAHSSEESYAFYRAVGSVDAVEINQAIARNEPFDCQMEYVLQRQNLSSISQPLLLTIKLMFLRR
ncbi:MAG: GNAT family N-acetyltransferase [Clostridia bacterium]